MVILLTYLEWLSDLLPNTQAVRTLTPVDELHPIIALARTTSALKDKVVWQTSERTFRHKRHENYPMLKDVVLDVIKAGPGEFIGWGEQGGTGFMKKPTFMNYFSKLSPYKICILHWLK